MELTTPSGKKFSREKTELLYRLCELGFIRWRDEPFSLQSGIRSNVYVSGREELTEHPECLAAIGGEIGTAVWEHCRARGITQAPCLIGIPTAGTALAAAASLTSARSLPFMVMRPVRETHGANQRWVDGAPRPDRFYFTVDNTITGGSSKLETAKRLCEDGFIPERMAHLVLVDRQYGGAETLNRHGMELISLFTLLDLAYAAKKFGFWASNQLCAVEKEIEQHSVIA